MYNPKSLKAEEFISHEEILDTLKYADENKDNMTLINEILENAYANDIDSLEIDIHYEVCGQDAATICAEANGDSVYFYSLRSLSERSSAIDRLHSEYSAEEIAKFENFPSKYDVLNPISEAHSVEDLPALLTDTDKYVGH